MAFKAIEVEASDQIQLRSVELAITSRCNFRCSYCGAFDLNERQVLTGDAAIDIISDLPDLQRVKLSGGEVLLRFDDCLKVVEYCASRGIETQINTNGSLLDREKVRILNDAGLSIFHFSLDFTSAEEHARFYRVRPDVFPKIINAIRESVASPSIDTVVETIVFNETKEHLVEIHDFIAALGVTKHEIQMEIPGVHEGYKSTTPVEELALLLGNLIEHQRPGMNMYFSCLSAYIKPTSPHFPKIRQYYGREGVFFAGCIEGKNQLHVHSNGDIMLCELGAPSVIGNVFATRLSKLVESRPESLLSFVKSKHVDGTHVCFRNCDTPAEKKPSLLKVIH
ncbi:MAG TPA: radical SAM protein [Thermoanaerobaculia bacterium]|jgi:MoaA/NifB/PqqE/SkfB family radical SAM enzyme